MLRSRLTLALITATLLTSGAGAVLAQGNNPDFRLNNRTGATINEVYVSSSRSDGWGRDRLGDNVLSSGRGLNIVLPAGQCTNDIRVVFENGQSQERRGVNTCGITEFNFTR
jgi:hypothetical protein